jgi:hypothetical protein
MIELLRRGFDQEVNADSLAEALRRHANDVAGDDVEQLAAVLDQFLRTVPDALRFVLGMSKDERCGRAVAFATGSILTYLFDEDDLLPEASFGTLGLLDDAYLAHCFAAMLRQTFPFAEPSVAYASPDSRSFEAVASLLPEGVAQSLVRTSESTIQVARAFFPSTQGAEAGDARLDPVIRVDEAVRTASG